MNDGDSSDSSSLWVGMQFLCGGLVKGVHSVLSSGSFVVFNQALPSILGLQCKTAPEFVSTIDQECLAVEAQLKPYANNIFEPLNSFPRVSNKDLTQLRIRPSRTDPLNVLRKVGGSVGWEISGLCQILVDVVDEGKKVVQPRMRGAHCASCEIRVST
jgi:hypothetical protein